METKIKEWNAYLAYLKGWADEHKGIKFFGTSPACFAEWQDNEAAFEEMEVDIDTEAL